ncbi:ABC transporter ATP-binding protein [Fusibacter bizertensis]|uniref:ABC transporter ATP-binding protein n=1 Tax=Fusibacter bizertensis TaxID=1488331 RepID=A0ABT6N8L0_9FIRM|nr:ABC transporter ATP-binding protein [Fusibacter bizertensis]MDH8676762.1 ABC transporter ATP-binding protein [Fusibacter bizertensis]
MNYLINCINLQKNYMSKKALIDINLKFQEGKIYGLLGPNGSGKTTLMKIFADLHKQTSGELVICDEKPSHKTRAYVAYMPTENFIYGWMKVKESLGFYADMYADFDKEKAIELLKFMEIDMNQKVSSLSTGQRARLKITLTISRKAKIYMLDEPLNGLDPISRSKIKECIIDQFDAEGVMIISTHLVNEIEQILDEVVFLDHGEVILAGETEKMRLEKGKSLEEIYKEVYGHA